MKGKPPMALLAALSVQAFTVWGMVSRLRFENSRNAWLLVWSNCLQKMRDIPLGIYMLSNCRINSLERGDDVPNTISACMGWIEGRTTGMNLPYLTVDKKMRRQFQCPNSRVINLVDFDVPELWGHLNGLVLPKVRRSMWNLLSKQVSIALNKLKS